MFFACSFHTASSLRLGRPADGGMSGRAVSGRGASLSCPGGCAACRGRGGSKQLRDLGRLEQALATPREPCIFPSTGVRRKVKNGRWHSQLGGLEKKGPA